MSNSTKLRVQDSFRHRITVTLPNEDELELELPYALKEPDAEYEVHSDGGEIVVFYKMHDELADSSDIWEGTDGWMQFVDRFNEPNHEAIQAVLAEKEKRAHRFLAAYRHGGTVWARMGNHHHFPDQQWDVSRGAGLVLLSKDTEKAAWMLTEEVELKRRGVVLSDGPEDEAAHKYSWRYRAVLPDGRMMVRKWRKQRNLDALKATGGTLPPRHQRRDDFERQVDLMVDEFVETLNAHYNGEYFDVGYWVFDTDGSMVGEDYDNRASEIGSCVANKVYEQNIADWKAKHARGPA